MKVNDLFHIVKGGSLELINMSNEVPSVNFVSRTSDNNGVVAHIDLIDGIEPYPAGSITVALGGSVLSAFVQEIDFYTAYHIAVLFPKNKMSLIEKLYYCHLINANKYRYNYGRQANRTLENIEIPNEIPKWVYQINIELLKESLLTTNKEIRCSFNLQKWNEFRIDEIFTLVSCKCSNASELIDGNDLPYIGAKKTNNGVKKYVECDPTLITTGNCIVFICDGQGSVGYCNYVEVDFIGSTTLVAGYNANINKYNGLFISTVANLERPKYSFGRKYKKNLPNTLIKLPATDMGYPDWNFMEKYIKQLAYTDKI